MSQAGLSEGPFLSGSQPSRPRVSIHHRLGAVTESRQMGLCAVRGVWGGLPGQGAQCVVRRGEGSESICPFTLPCLETPEEVTRLPQPQALLPLPSSIPW